MSKSSPGEAAGVDQQRRAKRKPDERRVALSDVDKRDVQPPVAARAAQAQGSAASRRAAPRPQKAPQRRATGARRHQTPAASAG